MQDNNSFVRQPEEKKPDFDERKKDLVQYDNVKQVKVNKKENAVGKWISTMFFSGRTIKEILTDIAENQLVPQIKDNFRNGIVSFVDLWIYKDHRTTSTSSPSGSFVTNYVQFSNNTTSADQKKALEQNKQQEQKLISSGYETPAFRDINQARDFLKSMHAYCTKYETLSVQDLAWMQRKVVDYTWDKYGWYSEEVLAVKEPSHVNNPDAPWAILLPKAHVLN